MAKYRNKKVIVDGIEFDSKRESKRYQELRILERAGEIQHLLRQVPYELLPAQYEHGGDHTRNKGKCLERAVKYIADFQYIENGKIVVEDVKGVRTKDYILKRKMMLYFYGIRIKEI